MGRLARFDQLRRENIDLRDTEVMDKLFIMFDKLGDGVVNGKEFAAGLAGLTKGFLFAVLQPRRDRFSSVFS